MLLVAVDVGVGVRNGNRCHRSHESCQYEQASHGITSKSLGKENAFATACPVRRKVALLFLLRMHAVYQFACQRILLPDSTTRSDVAPENTRFSSIPMAWEA